MQINEDYLALIQKLGSSLSLPTVTALHLPPLELAGECRDQFGFLFLDDDTAAPFYVSLPGMLDSLWQRFPDPRNAQLTLQECLDGFHQQDLQTRALALGAWNALSHHIFRASGFQLPSIVKTDDRFNAGDPPIGMVGYFFLVMKMLVEDERFLTKVLFYYFVPLSCFPPSSFV